MSIYTRNEYTKTHILDLANCHCTFRVMDPGSETSAKAICNESGKVRATISWRHKDKETIVSWRLPIGISFDRRFRHDATSDQVDAAVTNGFVKMDNAWQLEES